MKNKLTIKNIRSPFIVILGIAQDGGVPQAGCRLSCCLHACTKHMVVSLGIVDPESNQRWLIDTTPDIGLQLMLFNTIFPVNKESPGVNGIFFTHGHIGHFTGLLQFERAVMNTHNVTVHAMPHMAAFISTNLPWMDLVTRKNIILQRLHNKRTVKLNSRISLTPFVVPHRDEHTETVGFLISGMNKKILFIPDIDRWEDFPSIKHLVRNADFAFLDGTFFDNTELPNRNLKEIPHPFICHSIDFFSSLPNKDKNKISFIHFNHTNPVLNTHSSAHAFVINHGFHLAKEGDISPI